MTVIKGTFPVRFRVDGKDGEGLWVRYAVTLDKWDDTLQKSYPSNMFTIPTGDCIYIGIAVGAGNAPIDARYYDWLKFVGVDGQSFIIRGVCEEVYSYDAFYDEVEKVVGKVYLLEDYDNEDFNALAVRWTDSGAVNLGAVDGDAYVKSSNRFLFVKNKNRWQSLGSIQGPKGDPGNDGKDGEDAVSYKLSSSISALPLNNDGSPQITSFTLSAVMRKGATVVPFDNNYILFYYIYHNSDTRPNYKSQWLSSSISSMTVNLTNINDIKNISCSLKYRENNAYKTLDSFDILPIKAGAAGVSYFPNMRGYWELEATYQWQGMSRDMVVWRADGDDKPYLYAVKTAGTTVKETLLSPDEDTKNWEKAASPFSMLFANFVYTDNASVGGFVYSEEQMRSTSTTDGNKPDETGSNCNILIDGKKGFFRALNAEIQGKITATSGTFDNCTIKETCTIKKIDAEKGTIGGFEISSSSIGNTEGVDSVNGMSLFKDFICFNENANTAPRQAILGTTNSFGTDFLCRLADTRDSYDSHNGLIFDIRNSKWGANFAFKGNGNGVLNGMVEGFMLNDFTPSSSVNAISPQKGNYVIVKGSYTMVYLPTLSECRESLGLSTTTTTKFAMMMTVVCAGGRSTPFTLYGYRNSTYGANCPHLRDNNYNDLTGGITMGAGDIVRVLITYDGSNFDAYLISHRD